MSFCFSFLYDRGRNKLVAETYKEDFLWLKLRLLELAVRFLRKMS